MVNVHGPCIVCLQSIKKLVVEAGFATLPEFNSVRRYGITTQLAGLQIFATDIAQ